MADYLHNLKVFPDLLQILGEEKGIDSYLIEKGLLDYACSLWPEEAKFQF